MVAEALAAAGLPAMAYHAGLPREERQRRQDWFMESGDAIMVATEKARQNDAYGNLTDQERKQIDRAVNELLVVYHHDDYLLIRAKIEQLNQATLKLAETIMNTVVSGALKGTKI